MNKHKTFFPLVGSVINVQAYKYDGTLYRQWNGVKVLKNTEDHFVLFISKTQVTELNKRNWVYNEPVVWFLPKNNMYNALVIIRKNKKLMIYVNMASRPIYEDNTIKFIDFDLDLKKYPGHKTPKLVDRDEFKENAQKYNYSSDLIDNILDELDNLLDKEINKEYFFDKKVVDFYIDLAIKDKSLSPNFLDKPRIKRKRNK